MYFCSFVIQEYSIQSYLGEFWKDHRLNLSGYLSEMNEPLNFPTELSKYIWVPDLVFDNTRHGVLFTLSQPNTVIKLNPNGYFIRSSRFVIKLLIVNNSMNNDDNSYLN